MHFLNLVDLIESKLSRSISVSVCITSFAASSNGNLYIIIIALESSSILKAEELPVYIKDQLLQIL